MKKSRIAKLALLGASTAALIGTLSTSTYAWYVSNKTATATSGAGTTGSADSDGSIMLSWDGSTKWVKSLTMGGNTKDSGSNMTTTLLTPCHYAEATYKAASGTAVDGTTYYTRTGDAAPYTYTAVTTGITAGTTDVSSYYVLDAAAGFYGIASDGSKGSLSSGYVTVSFYAKASAAGTASVTLTTTSTTAADGVKQTLYAASGTSTAGSEINVNVLDALYCQQVVGSDISYAACDGGTKAFDSTAGLGTAHQYLVDVSEDVTALNNIWARTPNGTAGLSTITLAANTPTLISYTFFLDGGDVDCFNACADQDFTFAFTYTYTKSAS